MINAEKNDIQWSFFQHFNYCKKYLFDKNARKVLFFPPNTHNFSILKKFIHADSRLNAQLNQANPNEFVAYLITIIIESFFYHLEFKC